MPPPPPLNALPPDIETPPPEPPGPDTLASPPPPTQASSLPPLKRYGVLIYSFRPAITYSVFASILSLKYENPPSPPAFPLTSFPFPPNSLTSTSRS